MIFTFIHEWTVFEECGVVGAIETHEWNTVEPNYYVKLWSKEKHDFNIRTKLVIPDLTCPVLYLHLLTKGTHISCETYNFVYNTIYISISNLSVCID